MGIKLNIFYPRLKQSITDPDSVQVTGDTIGECLDDLISQFPGTDKWLFNEQGQLLRHVYVCVNAESAYKVDMTTPVKEGDTLIIAALITGG